MLYLFLSLGNEAVRAQNGGDSGEGFISAGNGTVRVENGGNPGEGFIPAGNSGVAEHGANPGEGSSQGGQPAQNDEDTVTISLLPPDNANTVCIHVSLQTEDAELYKGVFRVLVISSGDIEQC